MPTVILEPLVCGDLYTVYREYSRWQFQRGKAKRIFVPRHQLFQLKTWTRICIQQHRQIAKETITARKTELCSWSYQKHLHSVSNTICGIANASVDLFVPISTVKYPNKIFPTSVPSLTNISLNEIWSKDMGPDLRGVSDDISNGIAGENHP